MFSMSDEESVEEKEEDAISIDLKGIKEKLNNKKVIVWSTIVFLLAVIISGVWIRTLNLSLLRDATTGKYIPLALDPFYWLRMAQTIVQLGHLPAVDPFRIIQGGTGYSHELVPWVVAYLYKFLHIFNSNITLGYADVIYPVVAFVFGIIAFFFLVKKLTKSKLTAWISTAFLAMIPTYLYRTMAGFADHDSIGMLVFFSTLLVYTYTLEWLGKEKDYENRKNRLMKPALLGVLIGFLSVVTLFAWGGISQFLTMIIPMSFALLWILKTKNIETKSKKESESLFVFYIMFMLFALIVGLILGYSLSGVLSRFITNPVAILMSFTLLFVIVDFFVIKYNEKIKLKHIKNRHIAWAGGASIILGLLVLMVYKGGAGAFFGSLINRFLHPFGTNRVSLTVAENAQPYIADWISQTGPYFFWLVFAGLITFGINIASGIKSKNKKRGFIAAWVFLIAGLLLTRISPTSILNGTNFISQLLYFGSMVVFFLYCVRVYRKSEIKVSEGFLILFSLMVVTLIAARAAQYLVSTITPFLCIFLGYLIFNLSVYWKKSKDETLKLFLVAALIAAIVLSIISFSGFVSTSIAQSQATGPSADSQWQNAMAWVRNNTAPNAIFAHWWDYGYWVEYLGQRATIADGGHFEGAFRDYLIGRYLLTEPNPNVSLSFLKSNNVTNLLIDQSDLGKYGAFSIIGSNANGTDRYAQVPVMPNDPSQTQETANGTRDIYTGGTYLYQDIVYPGSNGQQIFLPAGQAGIGAVAVDFNNNSIPQDAFGIFIYNSQQYNLPLRYVYFNNKMYDFGVGINSTVDIIPSVGAGSNQQLQINRAGAAIYLSPKVSQSLYAQLYLLNDPFNRYPTVKLVHAEPDPLVSVLNQQGANLGEFVYYQGFHGPIKIWNVTYPNYILSLPQFRSIQGTYGEFDNLTVVNTSVSNSNSSGIMIPAGTL